MSTERRGKPTVKELLEDSAKLCQENFELRKKLNPARELAIEKMVEALKSLDGMFLEDSEKVDEALAEWEKVK